MSNCLPCSDPIAPCQGCKKSQECIQTGRSCTQCPRNICIDSSSSSSSSKDSGPSTGTTAGAAVGGVVGVAVLILVVWWFWWRPKGLEVSRKRYSKHLANRQSKLQMMDHPTKRKTVDGAGMGGDGENVAKRTSVHLKMTGDTTNNRRSQGNLVTAEGVDETVPVSRTSDDDNPFGDQNRSSIGTFNDNASTHTSEFSFRSSHSTNIIPIAYIPPHSSSLSVDDAQRGAYGQHQPSPSSPRDRQSALPPPRSSMNRISIPTSMASRDSLALAGGELIELNPLPPVLIPDQPSNPHGTMSNGAPIRPPRSPGLDLQLPKSSSPLASSPPINSPYDTTTTSSSISRPRSGFPFSPSSPTTSTTPNAHQLLPPTSRGMSFLHDPSRSGSNSAQSNHLSMMSTITSRSGNSTMSYILDPPQIITPVSGGSGGVKRVEFQQAKAHKLGGGGGGNNNSNSPTSPLATNDPFSDVNSISSSSQHRRDESQEIVTGGGRGSSTGETGSSSRPISSSSRWTTSSLSSEASEVQFLQGQSITFTNPNTPSPHSASTLQASKGTNDPRGSTSLSVNDLPTSARSSVRTSYASANDHDQRQSTWSSTSDSNQTQGEEESQSMSRASSSSHDSLLEGIPFMSPPTSRQLVGPSTSSINLGLPVNVTATQLESIVSPSPTRQETPTSFPPPPPRTSTLSQASEDEPLPLPFLPFAGQRPTSTSPTKSTGGGGERQSEHFSVRSGFGSGLSQIPFQLGFPSGFGEGEEGEGSERGSMISRNGEGKERWSTQEDDGEGLSEVEERTEEESIEGQSEVKPIAPPIPFVASPSPSAPPELATEVEKEEQEDPFGSHAEIDASGPRASMDTLALSAALSANLDADN